MRIKNLRGVSEVRFKKKLDFFTLETSKTHLIRNFLRNGRLSFNIFCQQEFRPNIFAVLILRYFAIMKDFLILYGNP